jgi:uncharacterized protein YjbI with pentapeptide repeats
LTEQNLRTAKLHDDVRLLAGAETSTVLREVDAPRKRSLLLFLWRADLINEDDPLIDLGWADLRYVNLSGDVLFEASLSSADLSHAVLTDTDLTGSDFAYTRLHRADLSGADLSRANLGAAQGITPEQLERQARSLRDAIMPDGQKYEDWLKDKEGRGEDGENSGPS